MLKLEHEFLYSISIDLGEAIPVGQTPNGVRMIMPVVGGTFKGPKMNGQVLNSGADWALLRPDGSLALDVRCALETSDGASIYSSYGGRIIIPEVIASQFSDPDQVEEIDPSDYYFRITPYYETSSERYAWKNNVVAIGVGKRTRSGVYYDVYEIK